MKEYTFRFLQNLQSLSTWMALCWIKRYIMMHGEVEVYYHVLLNRCMRWIYVVSFALRQLYLPGKRSQPLNMRPSGPQSRFERFSEEKRSFHLGGIGPRYLGPPQPVYWSLLSELSWLHRIPVIAVKFNHPCDKSSKKLQDVIGGQVTIPPPPPPQKLGSFGGCSLFCFFWFSGSLHGPKH